MKKILFYFAVLWLFAISASAQSGAVITYPAPDGAPVKHDYDVLVQSRGSNDWTHVDTYMVGCSK